MDFDLQARDGVDVQVVKARCGELAVEGLDREAEVRRPHCSAYVLGAMLS